MSGSRSGWATVRGPEFARGSSEDNMLKGALMFLVVGLIAALLGFTTIAGASFAIAKVLAGIFLLIFLVMLVMALFVTRAV
jgi:uncharacterized membrane protein YtjA (UPF0391 family)